MIPKNCRPADFWSAVMNELVDERERWRLDTGEGLDIGTIELYEWCLERRGTALKRELGYG